MRLGGTLKRLPCAAPASAWSPSLVENGARPEIEAPDIALRPLILRSADGHAEIVAQQQRPHPAMRDDGDVPASARRGEETLGRRHHPLLRIDRPLPAADAGSWAGEEGVGRGADPSLSDLAGWAVALRSFSPRAGSTCTGTPPQGGENFVGLGGLLTVPMPGATRCRERSHARGAHLGQTPERYRHGRIDHHFRVRNKQAARHG